MAKRILVVDDEFAIRDMMDALLSDEGYDVWCAANGQHGLAALAQGRPDLILSDWMMPVMNGLEFCHALYQNPDYRTIPLIVMSAIGNRLSFDACNYIAVLDKPFDINLVMMLIEQIICTP